MLSPLLITLICIIFQHGSAVNIAGCYGHKQFPLVFDATRQKTGEIKSAGFDEGGYPNNAVCDYNIKASPGYIVKLTFLEMDVYPNNRCGKDAVFVMDGDSDGADLGVYCGTEPPPFPILSTKNGIHLRLRTDNRIQRKGFRVRYEVILPSEVCPPGQYRCTNNRCYSRDQKCNGVDDCLDGSDEEKCNLPLPAYSCGISSIFPIESSSFGPDRVVGGIEARPHSWPWQVSMETALFYPNSHQCGGTLIHPQWVMTAAHCLGGYPYAEDWRIHLGNHNRFKKDRYEQIRLVERLVMWPGRTGDEIPETNVDFDQDIALIKLNAPVQITEGVRPACLPKAGYEISVGEKCTVTGWGETRGTGSYENLKQADMYVQSEENCPTGDKEFKICLESRDSHQGICHGDSGGPLACKINGKYHVLGISSFITRTNFMSGLCAVGGGMSVYNKVSNKIAWINGIIDKYS